MSLRGISVFDILGWGPPGSNALLPDDVKSLFQKLQLIDHNSVTTESSYVHFGKVRIDDSVVGILPTDALKLPKIPGNNFEPEAPELNRGVYFRLLFRRRPTSGAENVEPLSLAWTFHLLLDPISYVTDLVPAELIPAAGVSRATLKPLDTEGVGNARARKHRFFARGAFRIAFDGDSDIDVGFANFPDPFDPDEPEGPVFEAWSDPPHFFANDHIGVTIDKMTIDQSVSTTPPVVAARGQPANWTGIAVDEATVYGWDAPLIGPVNLGVRDLIWGMPRGIQGELFGEFGRLPDSGVPELGPIDVFTLVAGTETLLEVKKSENTDNAAPKDVDKERLFEVELPSTVPTQVAVRLRNPPPDTSVEWVFDRSSSFDRTFDTGTDRQKGNKTTFVTVNPHDTVKLIAIRDTEVDGTSRPVMTDSIQITFKPANVAASSLRINLPDIAGGIENVVSISGSPTAINGLRLVATGDNVEGARWEGQSGNLIKNGTEHLITSIIPKHPEGMNIIQFRNKKNETRRVNIHILASGSLVIGAEAGVFDKDGNTVPVHRLRRDFDLLSWHSVDKMLKHREVKPGVDADGTIIVNGIPDVTDGVIAELYLKAGSLNEEADVPSDTDPNFSADQIQHVQLRFKFDESRPFAWLLGPQGSGGSVGTSSAAKTDTPLEELVAWLRLRFGLGEDPDQTPVGKVLIVGRTDDIQELPGYNKNLATDRAINVRNAILELEPRLSTITFERGEQTQPAPPEIEAFEESLKGPPDLYYKTDRQYLELAETRPIDPETLANAAGQLATPSPLVPTDHEPFPPDPEVDFSLINRIYDPKLYKELSDGNKKNQSHLEPRPKYRRVDIFIESPLPVGDSGDSTPGGERNKDIDTRARITFVPGVDIPEPKRLKKVDPKFPFLVRKTIAWDSPTYNSARDAIPTKFECSFTWAHRTVKLPGVVAANPQDVKPCDESLQEAEFFTILGRMRFDPRTLETIVNLSLASEGDPKGLYCSDIKELAAVLAIGPALLPLVDDLGGEGAAKLSAIAAAAAIAFEFAEKGTVVLEKIEAEQRFRSISTMAGSTARLSVDYRANVEWDFGLIGTSKKPDAKKPGLEISYKNLGILIPTGPVPESGPVQAENVQFVYDDASIDIKNPGLWTINNETLGKLLRVASARVGTGSAWVEVDLELALDLGVVKISKATVRASFKSANNIEVELRGLEVEIDVPGTLRGKGRLAVAPDGGLRTAMSVDVIPAGVAVGAALALKDNFFLLQLETRFSTPIPLFSTGLGIFGFSGLFVANGERNLPPPGGSIADRELAWFALNPENKYRPAPGKWAFGLGTIVGTLPDQGFMFNAKGMLAVEVPDLEVVLGIDGQFLRKPGKPTQKGDPVEGGATFRLKGMVVVNDDFVSLGVKGDYKYRKLLKIHIPLEGFFPFSGDQGFFLRVGTDNFAGDPPDHKNARPGSPITAVVLPDSLKLKATAFVLIEEHGIQNLGAKTEPPIFDFPGFAVGTGLTFRLEWGNRFIGVDVGAELLAGFGTDPLTIGAGITIHGEVTFLLLSAGIKGELIIFYYEGNDGEPNSDQLAIIGKLCARVGFWRFKKTKCGTVKIPDEPADAYADYRPPSPLKGIDLVGRNDQVVGAARKLDGDGEIPIIWPDVMPALHFAHPVRVELPADSAFAPGDVEGPAWVGSKDIQNAYRIKRIVIRPKNGPPLTGPLPSAWTFPSHRASFGDEGSPSIGDEHRDLHLLTDMKHRWARNLMEGGLGITADPVESLNNICTPTPPALPACALGDSLTRLPDGVVQLATTVPSPPPFSTRFDVMSKEGDLDLLSTILGDDGFDILPGLRVPIVGAAGATELHGARFQYLLPMVREADRLVTTLPIDCRLNGELVRPEIILSLCDHPRAVNPGLQCDTYEDLKRDFVTQNLARFGLKYESIHVGTTTGFMFTTTVAGRRGIRITGVGAKIQLPIRTKRVRAQVVQLQPTGDDVFPNQIITMVAKDRFQNVIETRQIEHSDFGQPKTIDIRISSDRIAFVELKGTSNQTHLIEFCYQGGLPDALRDLVSQSAFQSLPRVVGVRIDGTHRTWVPQLLNVPGDVGLGGTRCRYIRYRPPGDAVWSSIKVGPWIHQAVGIVAVCGVSAEADEQQQEVEENRQDTIDDWNSTPAPARFLLEADTEYEVDVEWEALTWIRPLDDEKPSQTERTPPNINSSAADALPKSGDVDTFTFRTAAEDPLPPEQPLDTTNEKGFDPRATRRYLTRVRPNIDDPPHFLDDPVRVVRNVSYLDELLGKYGRELDIRVRRTDPPVASQVPTNGDSPDPPDTKPHGFFAVAIPLDLLDVIDARILEETEAPCLNPRDPEGQADDYVFDLEPRAEYDLLVTSPKLSGNEEQELIVERRHFSTSRYASASELLQALDLNDSTPGLSPPVEALVSNSVIPDSIVGDAEFDDALSDLGLDPFPIAASPRVVTLISRTDKFEVAGVLIEADEPVQREGRCIIDDMKVLDEDGNVVANLTERRRSTAGTRALFMPDQTIDATDQSLLLTVEMNAGREGRLNRQRYLLLGGASLAFEEAIA